MTEPEKRNEEMDPFLLIIGIILCVICTIILAFELFVAIYKSPEVFTEISDFVNHLLVITPAPVSILTLTGVALQIFYIVVLISVALAVGYLLFKFIRVFSKFLGNGSYEPMKKNVMFEFATLFAAIYFLETAFIIALVAIGVDIEGSVPFVDETPLEMMFLTLEASVWEEIVSRMLLIGVPMLILALATSNKEKWWKWLTGGFGMNQYAVVFIIFSAVFFGLAHVPGWDPWKFVPTFIFGLGAGYLFVRYGLYASIALHFIFNYLTASDWLLNDDGTIFALILMPVLIMGIPFAWVYAKRGISYLKKEFSRA